MSEKKEGIRIPEYMKKFDAEKIEKSAQFESLPTISVSKVGLEHAIDVVLLKEPNTFELPKAKQIHSTEATTIEVDYLGNKCQIYCTEGLLFNLGMTEVKHGKSLIGSFLRLWKEMVKTKHGVKPMYQVSLRN
jgi:hypothetical protein